MSTKPVYQKSPRGTYKVRLYDMFDGWIDCTGAISEEDAITYWNKETNNGTRKICYGDGDYYAIFPAETTMIHTPEFRGR